MNDSPLHVCNYAVLRFLPYPETGEFVNLGIVVHCAQKAFMAFRMAESHWKRVTDFFPELDPAAFQTTRQSILQELERVRDLIRNTGDPDLARRIFRDLIKPRESVFRFGESRTVMTRDLEGLAEKLFAQYVGRHRVQLEEALPAGETANVRAIDHITVPESASVGIPG